jgi:prepilin-type N-terminal cleavage/methylation domain-containing protein/prepilin-type processing-associated H-X9-DG protein
MGPRYVRSLAQKLRAKRRLSAVIPWHPRRRGLTLIELLIVVAIIALLIALTIPAVQRVRAASERLQCSDHLRQIAIALHSYHGTHTRLPPGCSYQGGTDAYPLMSWMTRCLPYLEQETLWEDAIHAFSEDKWFESPPHQPILARALPVFTCPSDSRTLEAWNLRIFQVGLTSYLGVEGLDQTRRDGVLFLDSRVRFADITDGLSNTLMVGERPPSADGHLGWWYAGAGQSYDGSADSVLGVREVNLDLPGCPPGRSGFGPGKIQDQCDCLHFWSLHPGGANFALADGSVHFLTYSASSAMPALSTRGGGEIAEIP